MLSIFKTKPPRSNWIDELCALRAKASSSENSEDIDKVKLRGSTKAAGKQIIFDEYPACSKGGKFRNIEITIRLKMVVL